MTAEQPGPVRAPFLAAAIVVLALLVEAWSRGTPAPVAADAPAREFSAGRALAVLERLLGDEAPHPVGSPANARVRERIVDELRGLGLTPEVQSSWICDGIVCAPVVNVTARIAGRNGGAAVLLLAHYDSVHAGPGAGDDTHGVAVLLEVARALVDEPPDRPVLLLFDEGEEVGLLGAELFVRDRQRVRDIAVAINVEARGTSGRTSMFETSKGNAELVRRFAAAVPRPEASSLSVEVYRRMPNDTDLTVLLGAGVPGINLAFIGGVARYHTPLDDLAHLEPGSVQHQGDTVLAATRAFATGEPPERAGEAAFADLFGVVLVRWPAPLSMPLVLAGTLALVVACVRGRRRGLVRVGGVLQGMLAGLLVWIGAAIAALLLVYVVGPLAHPASLRLACWATLGAATIGLGALVGRRLRAGELALGTWLLWALLAIALVAIAPGAAPAFVMPLVPAAAAFVVATVRARGELANAAMVGLAAFAIVWAALAFGLEDAFGWALAPAIVVPAAAVTSHAAWAFVGPSVAAARRTVLAACLALACAGALAAITIDTHERAAPRHFTIVHLTDADAGTAVLTVAAADAQLPDALFAAAAFAPEPIQALPWTRAKVWTAASQPHDRAPPWLDRMPGGDGSTRARLVAPWADRAMITIDDADRVTALTVAGESTTSPGVNAPWRVHLFGLGPDGVELGLERDGPTPVSIRVVACGPTLPADAAALADARDAVGVTFQWGDSACIVATEQL